MVHKKVQRVRHRQGDVGLEGEKLFFTSERTGVAYLEHRSREPDISYQKRGLE